MTTSDQALYACLSAATALTALLGTAAAGGPSMYPVEAPEGAAQNMVVWQIIATEPATTHGEGGIDGRLDMVHVQLTALAPTQQQAAAIIYQARVALESSATLKGVMTGEQTVPREDDANVHGRTGDFLIQNNPDL